MKNKFTTYTTPQPCLLFQGHPEKTGQAGGMITAVSRVHANGRNGGDTAGVDLMRLLTSILITLGLASCGHSFRLTTDELAFNPYKKGDVLVFQSDSSDVDSIFVLDENRFSSPTDPLDVFPDRADILLINVKCSDPYRPNRKQQYIESTFLKIKKANVESAMVDFGFLARDAVFYDMSFVPFSDLQRMEVSRLTTSFATYDDVIRLDSPNGEYRDRADFIKIVYWSKTSGYVRYDLLNGQKWELKKKWNGNQ